LSRRAPPAILARKLEHKAHPLPILNRPEGLGPEDLRLSRRALGAVVFGGYAAAALATHAAPIVTDAGGLAVETTQLPVEGGAIRLYVARPDAPGPFPAVIVVNEIFGLHAYILDVCRRLAKLGYVAVAPGFFDRAGDPAPLTDFTAIRKIVAAASDAQVMGDVGAALAWLKAEPFVAADRIAITGFCWGGRVVWNACETYRDLRAGVAWYGQMAPAEGASPDPSRQWPIDHVADLRCPVLGLYGGQDPLTKAAPAMRAALAAAGATTSQIVVYPDAGHGFHADYRESYNEADARDAWSRMLAFFAAHGAAPRAWRAPG